jgi:hypothetical protein
MRQRPASRSLINGPEHGEARGISCSLPVMLSDCFV